MKKILLAGFVSLLLVGCVTPSEELIPQANQVRVLTTSLLNLEKCNWVGEVTGNEGHWYSYLFYSNDALIQGAVNELKNNAHQIGADTVVTMSPHNFTTSVTLLGTAYDCR
ncbi:DUF4156 domain-containing protein [Photobacterium sp. DNB23_23_1]|uniref:DUF4156 domain-containing protein n=1 Tax=Photobacterium pectinilyticum TaxID=2906793 RepID=A0ABT1N7I6_9GAMM|nr:DUF4156 domain-containing protein [Photobacterium sp. ZSDE20]MCQ1060708.1 DUF4156 domain-containing protein [Photobacterium sp. ZSDE20]MDD1824090.1 DUF4156 domain-containing protein [Photobacterium sp. ZSDE20]